MKLLKISTTVYILFSAFSLLSVSCMAFMNPQSVMDLVQVQLNNTDAFSSIRGIYGGVGLTIVISLVYLLIKEKTMGLVFLSFLWGSYAISRTITIFVEGPLGSFGTQWLVIETILCFIAIALYLLNKKATTAHEARL